MPVTKRKPTAPEKTEKAPLMRCIDSHFGRLDGANHDYVVKHGDTLRADDPRVLKAPHLFISDDSIGEEIATASGAIYDRVQYNDTASTIQIVGNVPDVMEAIEDFPIPGGLVKAGSQFPAGHDYVRYSPQMFRKVDA
jgi:hypothetical protein